jgi:hypothetical protein
MIFVLPFLLLPFMAAILWLAPRVISRAELKVPARVPQEWVDDFRSEKLQNRDDPDPSWRRSLTRETE